MSNLRVKVKQDTDPMSPREWDNLGVMACWHRGYTLGDVQPKEDPQEWSCDFECLVIFRIDVPLLTGEGTILYKARELSVKLTAKLEDE